MNDRLPIALSNRHCHLTREHIDQLFGVGYELTKIKELSQPGQYACKEKVEVRSPNGSLQGVRVLGPARDETQVEILLSDSYKLGVKPPVKKSGDHSNSSGTKLITNQGEITLDKGLIVAARHIHMHPDDASEFKVSDNDRVKIEVEGKRGLIFKNVLIRVSPHYSLEMHVDLEEGNAAGVKNGTMVNIIK
jgi:putative phosphotransacetylase